MNSFDPPTAEPFDAIDTAHVHAHAYGQHDSDVARPLASGFHTAPQAALPELDLEHLPASLWAHAQCNEARSRLIVAREGFELRRAGLSCRPNPEKWPLDLALRCTTKLSGYRSSVQLHQQIAQVAAAFESSHTIANKCGWRVERLLVHKYVDMRHFECMRVRRNELPAACLSVSAYSMLTMPASIPSCTPAGRDASFAEVTLTSHPNRLMLRRLESTPEPAPTGPLRGVES